MSRRIELSDIENAVAHLKEQAEKVRSLSNHWTQRESSDRALQVAQNAEIALEGLRSQWSKFLSYQNQTERAYDIHVTAPQECTCHINPPCNFCIEQPE